MPDLFLFAVEDVLKIHGLSGHVLLPGIPCRENMPDIVVGAPLAIVTPGRSRIETTLRPTRQSGCNRGRSPFAFPLRCPTLLRKSTSRRGAGYTWLIPNTAEYWISDGIGAGALWPIARST